MIRLEGRYNSAVVYSDRAEAGALAQVRGLLDHPAFADSRIAVMPDVHVGKGSVVGMTMSMNGRVCPWVVGVDIGCGIDAYNLGAVTPAFAKLDAHIRHAIPAGFHRHAGARHDLPFQEQLEELVRRIAPGKREHILSSLGTLGGGNHFIELARGQDGVWLVLHSGSRHLGVLVAEYHQRQAARGKAPRGLEYLEGAAAEAYLADMRTAQEYAVANRRLMAAAICRDYFGLEPEGLQHVASIHNYINFEDGIVRKGAVAAHAGQPLVIPLNMRDGTLLGEGLGNPDWNFSAPHGAGRVLGRGEAKRQLSLEEYERTMAGIFSTSVGRATLDEAPAAYKPMAELVDALGPAVRIRERLVPVYNFKAG